MQLLCLSLVVMRCQPLRRALGKLFKLIVCLIELSYYMVFHPIKYKGQIYAKYSAGFS
ncbi:superoxide dismutase [Vibrio cholerae]|nr:superoxide dismutase [Vibrio cholerae]NAR34580.1 superoxide dismutase [Vibrio cholerae]